MKKMRITGFSLLAIIGWMATQAGADVLTGFLAGGNDTNTTTVIWNNLGGPVTATAAGVGNPTIDSVQNSLSQSGASGTIRMDVTSLDDVTTPFNPTNWTGGGSAGIIHTTTSGWGVNDSSGNGNMAAGEALILQFDFSDLTLGNINDDVVWTGADLAVNGAEIWKLDGGSGSLISSGTNIWSGNLVISDGDTFALVNGKTTAMRMKSLTVDVIPEPATLGLVTFFGAGILVIRRRLRR